MYCKCTKMGIPSNAKYVIFEAESELLRDLPEDKLNAYIHLVESGAKRTWGLCEYCDNLLRSSVLSYRRVKHHGDAIL